MADKETYWDKLLQIQTGGRDDANADEFRYPYEPTPYCVLERLADSGHFGKEDVLLDYGCGKGRVGFFLSYRTRIKSIGIEYDARIYQKALENNRTAVPRAKAAFVSVRAEEYALPPEVNRCYFFNPFSVEILRQGMARILESYYAAPREIRLFFYYPSGAFVDYLMTVDALEFYEEILCDDMFEGKNERERVLVYRLPGYVTEEE